MNELLYFSFADLMVRVEYNKEANSLRYASHRKITFGERVIVEQYLLTNVALKTDYYKQNPSLFIFIGTDKQLVKDLNLFHLKNTIKTLVSKEKDVQASVNGLISRSMQNYYFEQIGDELLTVRRETKRGTSGDRTAQHKNRLEQLIEAYNQYSEQKITLQDVIPSELRSYFGLSSSPQDGASTVARDKV